MITRWPLISIIVPVYNVEQYIEQCLDSIIYQSYKNIEIIVIDDGSTDKSSDIVKKYTKKDSRIKAIRKKNGGLSSARNVGIQNAHGTWISFIDSDDFIHKDFIKNMVDAIQNDKVDIVTCSVKTFSEDGSHLKKNIIWQEKTLSGHNAVKEMLQNKQPAYMCLSIFKNTLFKQNNITFPEGKNYEDISTRIKLLYSANHVTFIKKQLYYYRIRKNSITGKPFTKKRYTDFLFAISDAENFLLATNDQSIYDYVNYFKFYSLATLINYIAKEPQKNQDEKKYWKQIRTDMKKLYNKVTFPNAKSKLYYSAILATSTSVSFYSFLYRSIKNAKN